MSLEPKDQPRAMLWEPSAWLRSESVATMSFEAKGLYIDLLARGWENVGIPADPQQLARMAGAGLTPAKFKKLWAAVAPSWTPATDELRLMWTQIDPSGMWTPPEDRIWNVRQEIERHRFFSKKYKQSRAAKKAAEARWHSDLEHAA